MIFGKIIETITVVQKEEFFGYGLLKTNCILESHLKDNFNLILFKVWMFF